VVVVAGVRMAGVMCVDGDITVACAADGGMCEPLDAGHAKRGLT
jgi:hypothetical protein